MLQLRMLTDTRTLEESKWGRRWPVLELMKKDKSKVKLKIKEILFFCTKPGKLAANPDSKLFIQNIFS